MKRRIALIMTAWLCICAAMLPVHAAQTGVAGIEFYAPGGGDGANAGGGGSSSGGKRRPAGSAERDADPPRKALPEVILPDDEVVWMAQPEKDLGRLPETGSHDQMAAALVAAGIFFILTARRLSE